MSLLNICTRTQKCTVTQLRRLESYQSLLWIPHNKGLAICHTICIFLGSALLLPYNRPRRPRGCETSRIPYCLDRRLRDCGKVVSLTRKLCFTPTPPLPSQGWFLVLITVRDRINSRAIVRLEGLDKLKRLGNRDRAVGIATGYVLDEPGFRVRVPVVSKILISLCRLDWLWGPPNLKYNGYRELFLRRKSGLGLKLTTHLQLAPKVGLYIHSQTRLYDVVLN
jgi:hypothetical protein